jgi:hypothetical protein
MGSGSIMEIKCYRKEGDKNLESRKYVIGLWVVKLAENDIFLVLKLSSSITMSRTLPKELIRKRARRD